MINEIWEFDIISITYITQSYKFEEGNMSQSVYVSDDIKVINKEFEVADNKSIFRYMDFSKFIDIFENKHLSFCNLKYFEDEYEGQIPDGYFKNWSCETKKEYKDFSNIFSCMLGAYVNCWNIAEDESYALWKIYTLPKTGIAIRSTVGNLRKSLDNDNIKIYKVKYIKSFSNIEEKYEIPFYDLGRDETYGYILNKRFGGVYKQEVYRYENEVRAVYLEFSNKENINFNVDLDILIDSIYISPFASDWFYELVNKIVERQDYLISKKPIHKSEILLRKTGD